MEGIRDVGGNGDTPFRYRKVVCEFRLDICHSRSFVTGPPGKANRIKRSRLLNITQALYVKKANRLESEAVLLGLLRIALDDDDLN